MNTKTSKAPPDWLQVEIDYRAGIKSLKLIGKECGVSDAGIIKRAKRDGWERDLAAKIKAKTAAKVSAAAVSVKVSALTKTTENEIIEANSTMQTNIILAHRTDVQRSRKMCMGLLAELESQTDNMDLFEQLGELLRSEDDKGVDKRNDIYMKVISFSGRVKGMKDLSDSLKTLIFLERQAFNLSELPESEDASPMADRMKAARDRAKQQA